MVDYILKTSLERRWVVTIIYQKGSSVTKRNIKVIAMDDGRIRAFCYLRNEIRVFKRDNILSASFVRAESKPAVRPAANM